MRGNDANNTLPLFVFIERKLKLLERRCEECNDEAIQLNTYCGAIRRLDRRLPLAARNDGFGAGLFQRL